MCALSNCLDCENLAVCLVCNESNNYFLENDVCVKCEF